MVLLPASQSASRQAAASVLRPATATPQQSRAVHDLVIKRRTGFLGRYVVNRLAQKGTQVIVPYRDEDEKRHLKVMGDLGQIVPLEWDIRSDVQIEECLRHSDVVFNLTGRNYETKNFSFNDVHVSGAQRIAGVADACGVSRLIHVSHLNADKDSPSEFLRTKAEGEEAVNRVFEGATIVRPGPLYGHEDRFLNQMASWPITWHVNHGQTKLRPVHSLDVAQALEVIMDAENTSIGQTFSLAGPKTYTISELLNLVQSLTFRKLVRPTLSIPKAILMLAAKAGDKVWWPMLSPDEVTRRYIDDYPDAPGTKTFADLAIEPDTVEEVAITYLRRYRSNLHFERPIETGGARLKGGKQPYRVVD